MRIETIKGEFKGKSFIYIARNPKTNRAVHFIDVENTHLPKIDYLKYLYLIYVKFPTQSCILIIILLFVTAFKMGLNRLLLSKLHSLTLEMPEGGNTHITLNTIMKKTAVFHYTEWKNKEGGQGMGAGKIH